MKKRKEEIKREAIFQKHFTPSRAQMRRNITSLQ